MAGADPGGWEGMAQRVKFIDESACHLGLARAYGWARKNERCVFKLPGNTGPRRSVAALFSLSGALEEYRVQDGSLKGADFAEFIERQVAPRLSPGDVLVLDNAQCHKNKRARGLVEGAGARLLFLPAYSPDLSPIELAWRKVKARLRRDGARTREALLECIAEAVRSVTAQDARAFYSHCGYLAPPGPRRAPPEAGGALQP
jgi:transposase